MKVHIAAAGTIIVAALSSGSYATPLRIAPETGGAAPGFGSGGRIAGYGGSASVVSAGANALGAGFNFVNRKNVTIVGVPSAVLSALGVQGGGTGAGTGTDTGTGTGSGGGTGSGAGTGATSDGSTGSVVIVQPPIPGDAGGPVVVPVGDVPGLNNVDPGTVALPEPLDVPVPSDPVITTPQGGDIGLPGAGTSPLAAASVPEPSAAVLVLLGLGGLAAAVRRKAKR